MSASWLHSEHKSNALLDRFVRPLIFVLAFASLGAAQDVEPSSDESFTTDRIELVAVDDVTVGWNGQHYPGRFIVDGRTSGLVIINEVEPERYLVGIREVPAEWPLESLKAQAVAARTYLAWTLSRGRAGSGLTYGFDICATTACQVYLGGGDPRWADAVSQTNGEILMYDGKPAQALYSSTTGGRTRHVADVFTSSGGLPYLVAVDSADEDSPFVEWSYGIPIEHMTEILQAAGLGGDVLFDVHVVVAPDGQGPSMVEIRSSAGLRSVDTWTFRTTMNRWAERLFPDDYPALRSSGRRYPQVVLSPTFEIERKLITEPGAFDTPPQHVEFVITGNGWGHLVGMSQFGAKARADAGEDYQGILSHYYVGLFPTSFEFPDQITVGLGWKLDRVDLETGPVDVYIDGKLAISEVEGPWRMESIGERVKVSPPPGWDVPKTLADASIAVNPGAELVSVAGFVAEPGEGRIVVYRGDRIVAVTRWTAVERGPVRLFWPVDRSGSLRVVGQLRYSDGTTGTFNSVLSAS